MELVATQDGIALSNSSDYAIVNGFVVPVGSVVTRPALTVPWAPPTAEAATALFKQLFGVKRKRAPVEEEEDVGPKAPSDSEASASESDSAYEDSDEAVSEASDD